MNPHPDVVVVNASYGLPDYALSVDPQYSYIAGTTVTYSDFVDYLGILYDLAGTVFANAEDNNFLICSAVGYDPHPNIVRVQDDSPINNAAIRNPAGHYIAVEAVDRNNAYDPSAWGFGINLGGDRVGARHQHPVHRAWR